MNKMRHKSRKHTRAYAVPADEQPRRVWVKAERHAEVNEAIEEIETRHGRQLPTCFFVFPRLQKDAGILESETEARYHEDETWRELEGGR